MTKPIRQSFKPLLATLLLLALFLLPGRPGSMFDGIPLSTFPELFWVVIVFAFVACFAKQILAQQIRLLVLVILSVMVLLKVLAFSFSVPHGLVGEIRVADGFQTESLLSERREVIKNDQKDIFSNVDFRAGATSIGHNTFPIAFLNDSKRFNFSEDLTRVNLPWHLTLQGYLHVPRDEKIGFFLASSGEATVFIDGKQELDVRESKGYKEGNTSIPLSKGFHSISIEFAYEGYSRPLLELAWQLPNTQRKVIPLSNFVYEVPSAWQAKSDIIFNAIAQLIGLLILVASVVMIYIILAKAGMRFLTSIRARFFIIALVGFVVLTTSLWVYGFENDFRILQAGNDDLLYESNARHMLMTGDWLLRGPEPGPYYYNVLYQYVLAVTHMIVGPDIALVAVLQIVLLVATAFVAGCISELLFKRGGSVVMVTVLASEVLFRFTHMFFPIGVLPFLLIIYILLRWPAYLRSAVIVGILFGILVILRTNFFSILPAILLWQVIWARGRLKFFLPATTICIIAVCIAPVTIRNLIIGGEPVLINSNLANNILIGNPIPESVDLSAVRSKEDAKVNIGIRSVIEFAKQKPIDFAHLQWEKFLYYWGVRDARHAWEVLLPSIFTLLWLMLYLLFKRDILRKAWLPVVCILLMAFTNILSIPWNIRYILPIIPLLLMITVETLYYISALFGKFGFAKYIVWSFGMLALQVGGVSVLGSLIAWLIALWPVTNRRFRDV